MRSCFLRPGLLIWLLSACPLLADTPPATVDLTPLVCIDHANLQTAFKARGQTLYAAGSLADGRKLEVYGDAVTGLWTVVVVQRPLGGSVTKSMCSIIFGEGDAGVFIPPK
jgi:hypothetical protein